MADHQSDEDVELQPIGSVLGSDHPSAEDDSPHATSRTLKSNCPCGKCPIVPRTFFSLNGDGSTDNERGDDPRISRLDKPFDRCTEDDLRHIGRRIACEYHLLGLKVLFEKAALLIDDEQFWLAIGNYSRNNELGFLPAQEVDRRRSQDSVEGGPAEDQPTATILTEDEQIALVNEHHLGFWDQSWPFLSICYLLFVAAITQGWSQTGGNVAYQCWLNALIGHPTDPSQCDPGIASHRDLILYGAVDGAPFLFAPLGCWLSDPINELLLGRRRAIIVSGILVFASSIGAAYTNDWWSLLICRALLGIGMGSKAAVVPVFLAEIAPTHLRGTLIMNWQVFDALGILMGFIANMIASTAGRDTAWRWQLASAAIPAFALLVGCILIPWDSPRFLMKHERAEYNHYINKKEAYKQRRARLRDRRRPSGHAEDQDTVTVLEANPAPTARRDIIRLTFWERLADPLLFMYGPNPEFGFHSKTFNTLVVLRGHPLLAAKELIYTHCQLVVQRLSLESPRRLDEDIDLSLQASPDWFQRLRDLVRPGYLQRELIASIIVMASQQFSGVNVLIFYSSRLIRDPSSTTDNDGLIGQRALSLNIGIGLANFLFSLPAYWWIETRGRRFLLLTTIPLLVVTMAGAAASIDFSTIAGSAVSTIFTILFMIFYSPGMGVVPFTLSAEIFPLDHRMVGMSVAVSINFLLGGIFNLIVPLLNQKEWVLLTMFAGTNIIAWVLVWVFVREPETKPAPDTTESTALQLEEVFQIYDPSHLEHLEFAWQHKWDALLSVGDFLRGQPTPEKRRWYFINHRWSKRKSALSREAPHADE